MTNNEKTKKNNNFAMTDNNGFVLVQTDNLSSLFSEIRKINERIDTIENPHSDIIYTNKQVKELLGIEDKLLKAYRDNGWLSFSKVGDKYWYTQKDVTDFLNNNRFPSFT